MSDRIGRQRRTAPRAAPGAFGRRREEFPITQKAEKQQGLTALPQLEIDESKDFLCADIPAGESETNLAAQGGRLLARNQAMRDQSRERSKHPRKSAASRPRAYH
jgi:hypothetical protein